MLGPLRVAHSGRAWTPTAGADRRFLAELVAHAGQVVSTDHLAEAVWPARRPAEPANAVQVRASRLRRWLRAVDGLAAPERMLRTTATGYELRVDGVELDAAEFERALSAAAGARAAGRLAEALDGYRRAIDRYRGRPYADVPQTSCVSEEAARLENLYVSAVEEHAELGLALGRPPAGLVTELGRLARQHPLRERLHGALMLALTRDGQRGAALAAYRECRQHLVRELGVEPGPELRALHEAVLRGDPVPAGRAAPVASPVTGPHCLPRDTADFTGRAAEVAALVDRLTRDPMPPDVVAVDGMAGVGKTAYAVHVAHRLTRWYPDGQLYVNLCGHAGDRAPLPPAVALRALLASLGVPADRIPEGLEERAARWRAELAGRRFLVVLDDAAGADQVRPLLPGVPGATVLVTGRRRLVDLDAAVAVSLDVLPAGDARELFLRASGAPGSAPEAVDEVVRLCGRLPLALRIAAARLRHRPMWTVADLAEPLRDERRRLAELDGGDRGVAAAFALSVRDVDPAEHRMFRLLGLLPGTSLGAPEAAALAGVPLPRARRLLERLVDAHLVEEPATGRYRLHELLRDHARQAVAGHETEARRRAATGRLLDHYLRCAAAATAQLGPRARALPFPVSAPAPGVDLGSRDRAVAWLDAERENLVAAVAHAGAGGWDGYAWQLPQALYRYFFVGCHIDDWLAVNEVAYAAARRLGDRRAEGLTRLDLGLAAGLGGRSEAAVGHLTAALDLLRGVDDAGETQALIGLGNVFVEAWRYADAIGWYRRAVDRARAARHRRALALTLGNMGVLLGRLGRYAEATEHLRDALTAAREAGDPYRECHELCNLADVDVRTGRYDDALPRYREALDIARRLGDHAGESDALAGLAGLHRRLGRLAEAIGYHEEALRVSARIANRNREASIRNGYARTCRAAGRLAEARDHFERALSHALAGGNPYERAHALRGLADLLEGTDPDTARRYRAEARDTFARLQVPEAVS